MFFLLLGSGDRGRGLGMNLDMERKKGGRAAPLSPENVQIRRGSEQMDQNG